MELGKPLAELLNKRIKLILHDGLRSTTRLGYIRSVENGFIMFKSSESVEVWPISSIIRAELLEVLE